MGILKLKNTVTEILKIIPDYNFLSSSRVTFTRKDHILGHKTQLNKFEKTEIIQSILIVHNGIKLEIINRNIAGKIPKYLEFEQYTF